MEHRPVRQYSKAELYHHAAPALVPGYDLLQSEAITLLGFKQKDAFTVVDLGAGSGRLLGRTLSEYPNARGIWVDRSDDSYRIARDFLCAFGERVEFVCEEMDSMWSPQMPETVDAIISMSAIHHLEGRLKQKVFGECCGHLSERGVFINIDEVRDQDVKVHMINIRHWADHVKAMALSFPGTAVEEYHRRYCDRDRPGEAERSPEAQWEQCVGEWVLHRKLETVSRLVARLKEAGFAVVHVPVVYHMWACIYARK
jgi:ubiquinone/menaquinone biosynthesis C-methylase UbiE